LSPAIHIARYHVAALGMFAACICWLDGRRKGARLAEGTALVAALSSIMMFYWAPKRPAYSSVFEPAQIVRWIKTPLPKREVADVGDPPWMISAVNEQTGMLREKEIQRGDVVAFDHIDFAALLFNNSYSNRVVWLSSPDPLAEAERAGAKWIYTRGGSQLSSQLARAKDTWEDVGPLEREHVGNVWRRRR
jgi:frataxin-like iron-binding protein CyaY